MEAEHGVKTRRKSYDSEKAFTSDMVRMRKKGWVVLNHARRPVLKQRWLLPGPLGWLSLRGASDEEIVVTYGRSVE